MNVDWDQAAREHLGWLVLIWIAFGGLYLLRPVLRSLKSSLPSLLRNGDVKQALVGCLPILFLVGMKFITLPLNATSCVVLAVGFAQVSLIGASWWIEHQDEVLAQTAAADARQREAEKKASEQREADEKAERERRERERNRNAHESKRSWWEVLGVSPTATSEEIGRSYREKIRQYHPDRLHGLGAELLELAERRSKEINSAYFEAKRATQGRA
jgi:hypothetical protein